VRFADHHLVTATKTWVVDDNDHALLSMVLDGGLTVDHNREALVYQRVQAWIGARSVVTLLAFVKDPVGATAKRLDRDPHALSDYRNMWTYDPASRTATCIYRKVAIAAVVRPYSYHSFAEDMTVIVKHVD
jgi:hypothetical protein